MNCPKCSKEMLERKGRFGTFLFCPNQKLCKQATISKSQLRVSTPTYHSISADEYGINLQSVNWTQESEPNELGESYDSVNNEGDWYRPY